MRQLEELDAAAQRSVAAEVESAVEGGCCLIDEAGRERILGLCKEIRDGAAKLTRTEQLSKLQAELQRTATGEQAWQASKGCPATMPQLEAPRSSTPLSLWDWKVWSQARPTLWRYGNGGNIDPKRADTPLLVHEWIRCLCLRATTAPST